MIRACDICQVAFNFGLWKQAEQESDYIAMASLNDKVDTLKCLSKPCASLHLASPTWEAESAFPPKHNACTSRTVEQSSKGIWSCNGTSPGERRS